MKIKTKAMMGEQQQAYHDTVNLHLNPCSVETIPVPIKLTDGSLAWPCVVSCYELVDEIHQQQRLGQMNVSLIRAKTNASPDNNDTPLSFPADSRIVMDASSNCPGGILDGEWLMNSSSGCDQLIYFFATAHSSGSIVIHRFDFSCVDTLFRHETVGQSDPLSSDDDGPPPLCLSVRWNSQQSSSSEAAQHELVSTYSNGMVAIHDVFIAKDVVNAVLLRHCWLAHTFFRSTTPAEVWSASFFRQTSVLSGGDDGTLKLWDPSRTSLSSPMQTWKCFDAGVTCISAHPTAEHSVAVGSYDEVIRLFDARYLTKKPVLQTDPLGGGIWRIKWHPYIPRRALVAAMHGGCRVVNFGEDGFSALMPSSENAELDSLSLGYACTKEFTEHKSMAYGADWLVYPPSKGNICAEAAVSCSFYDRAVFMWDTSSG